jgi:hypothetical protein
MEGKMKINMGSTDRLIRVVLAIIIGVLYLTGQITGIALTVLGIFALVFLLTSSVGYCPLYKIFNISARKDKQKEKEEAFHY